MKWKPRRRWDFSFRRALQSIGLRAAHGAGRRVLRAGRPRSLCPLNLCHLQAGSHLAIFTSPGPQPARRLKRGRKFNVRDVQPPLSGQPVVPTLKASGCAGVWSPQTRVKRTRWRPCRLISRMRSLGPELLSALLLFPLLPWMQMLLRTDSRQTDAWLWAPAPPRRSFHILCPSSLRLRWVLLTGYHRAIT